MYIYSHVYTCILLIGSKSSQSISEIASTANHIRKSILEDVRNERIDLNLNEEEKEMVESQMKTSELPRIVNILEKQLSVMLGDNMKEL